MNNACSWLGTCVFPACNFLWGQVCSLTADEGSTLKLPRFIRFGNIQWRWRKAATFLSLLFTVLFRSLRRDDPQRCPVWTASLVWSGFWRLLRLHGYFFIPERRKPCELFPWIIVQPVLDISYELFRIFWNIGTFRNKASDKLVGTLIRTTFPCAVGVGVKHLCSWNVCQNRPFHSLEIKVFTAVVTGYRLEYFFNFFVPSLRSSLSSSRTNTLLTFTLYLTDYLYPFQAFGHYHKCCFCFLLAHHRIKLPMTENFFIFCFFWAFLYDFSFLKICSSNMMIWPFLTYIFTGRSSFVNLAKSPSSM